MGGFNLKGMVGIAAAMIAPRALSCAHSHDHLLETRTETFDFVGHNTDFARRVFPNGTSLEGLPFRQLSLVGHTPKLIVTCYDSRIVPEIFFEMSLGEVLVFRNAGGRTSTSTDVLKAALVSQTLTAIDEIMVIQHTDCGAIVTITDQQLIENIEESQAAGDSSWKPGAIAAAKSLSPIGFFGQTARAGQDLPLLEQMLKGDVEYLRNHPAIQTSVVISGWIYDVSSGVVTKTDY